MAAATKAEDTLSDLQDVRRRVRNVSRTTRLAKDTIETIAEIITKAETAVVRSNAYAKRLQEHASDSGKNDSMLCVGDYWSAASTSTNVCVDYGTVETDEQLESVEPPTISDNSSSFWLGCWGAAVVDPTSSSPNPGDEPKYSSNPFAC